MARILVEGFETGNAGQWDTFSASVGESMNVVSDQKHSGTYSIYNGNLYWSYWTKLFNITSGTLYGSFWHRWHYSTGAWGSVGWFEIVDFFTLTGPSTNQVSLNFSNALGTIRAMRGDCFGTTLASSSQWLLTYDTWHLIQFKIFVHPVFGVFQVWLDGVPTPVIDLNNINTQGDSISTTISSFHLGFHERTNGVTNCWWDDLILDDAALPGGSKIVPLTVNNNGASNLWTPTVGLNYQCIDEIPTNDADYVQTQGLENIDLFTTSGFSPGVPCNIKSIQESVRTMKDGVDISSVHPLLRSGATIFKGLSKTLSFSFKNETQIWETNPLTLEAFTIDEVGALQFGVDFSSAMDVIAIPSCVSLHLLLKG
jgi:hypothetical protein